jgi:hypothetical protein
MASGCLRWPCCGVWADRHCGAGECRCYDHRRSQQEDAHSSGPVCSRCAPLLEHPTAAANLRPKAPVQVQIIRIQLRVPEYGWTTQKVFHLLNFIVCGVRAGVFAFRQQVQDLHSMVAHAFLLDLPGASAAAAAAAAASIRVLVNLSRQCRVTQAAALWPTP